MLATLNNLHDLSALPNAYYITVLIKQVFENRKNWKLNQIALRLVVKSSWAKDNYTVKLTVRLIS